MTREDILNKNLTEFPDTPTLTLAKKIYKEHPAMFKSLELCRSAIRYRRGNQGNKNREVLGNGEHKRENGKAGFTMELPKSIAKPLRDFRLPEGKTGIMSDGHVPYHDDRALKTTLEYLDWFGPDNILLNGDMVDFFSISRWEKNPEERNLARELQLARQFLAHLRERFRKSRIIYKIGNHEERWEKYMWAKAPEVCGVADFEIYALLDFAKYGIEEVKGKQRMKAGKNLTVIHGHEMFGANAPVNFARTLQTNLGVCAIAGHRHQTSEHAFKNAHDKHIMCWSLGCLCDMRPEYAVLNKWNHGFATMELKKNDFIVDNKRIIGGDVV
jgi:predicted phosphodiesterase